MKRSLKPNRYNGIGLLCFLRFFLGAGNIIFHLFGQLAGDHFLPAMSGFLLTAVGLPLITIVAVAVAGGSWGHLTKDLQSKLLPSWLCWSLSSSVPAFAAPRTGLVAHEMAVKPFFITCLSKTLSSLFDCIFVVAMFFSWSLGVSLSTWLVRY